MDTALSPPVGQLLGGRYHVGSRIARGGMATVYLGTDTRLDRVVAIKIAHPELSGDAEFARRFIGEARSAARMSSPNVVAVYDQGTDGGLHFIAMEYVPGRTLRQLLNERGRLAVREALDIMSGVLSGLAAAHHAGFAHRDVKPENVLLAANGPVKVADFGLARSVAGAVQTKGGMIIGTAGYLAPEQVSGGLSDARTDVYAAGVMLFELLTGTQPHTGESPLAVAYKHVNQVVPPPSSVLPGLSPALDALVAMATSRDPELRPANAGQFLRALEQVRNGRPIPGTAPQAAAGRTDPGPGPGHVADGRRSGWPGESHPYRSDNGRDSREYARPGWEHELGAVGASALPSLSPQSAALAPMSSAALADDSSAVNHTLIVPASSVVTDYRGGQHGDPYGRRYRGRGTRRADSGRRLSDLLFSRRFFYLAGGLAIVLAVALVTWWLRSGQYTNVPPVHGVAVSTVKGELRTLGLRARLGDAQHNDLPKGEVISTRPAIGSKVTSGSVITLIVSLGPLKIQVPNVSGKPLSDAQAALRQAHLIPGTVHQATSSTVPSGVVISTTPAAYTNWPADKPVALTVSDGPGLPSFVGMQVSAAEAAASQGGYTIDPVADAKGTQPPNTITSQAPKPNTPIVPGEVVTVHYSPGPPNVAVPNVQGLSLHDAIRALRKAGFNFTIQQSGPGHTVGSYTPQGPQPQGTTITLVVGLFAGL